MRSFRHALGRAFWMVCACLLIVPTLAAAAESALSIDLDGDGRRDGVVLDGRESLVQVWLSASNTTQVIHTAVPVQRVVAADLDGDHRPELIARDSKSQIHVWTAKQKKFRPYHPHDAVPSADKQLHHGWVDDDDSEPADVVTNPTVPSPALALCASPRAPARVRSEPFTALPARRDRSSAAPSPFAPRPPPTRFAL
jgi:hypothetical protein